MPLNPPPTIELGLGLIVQPLTRNDQSRSAEVTFALNVAGVPSAAVAQDAVDDFASAFVAAYASYVDQDVTFEHPTIKLGDGSTVPFEATSSVALSVGLSPSTFAPPSVALLIKKATGLGGRKNRGRTYFPFILQDAYINENGTLVAVDQALLDVQNAIFLAQLTTDGNPMVIGQKTYNVPLAPHYVTHIGTGPLVTSYTSEGLIGTQRRRLGR